MKDGLLGVAGTLGADGKMDSVDGSEDCAVKR